MPHPNAECGMRIAEYSMRRAESKDGRQTPHSAFRTNFTPHSAFHQRFPFFTWSTMYSLVRHASARIVQVGFLSACDTNGPPSVTNRFLTSCAWHHRFNT